MIAIQPSLYLAHDARPNKKGGRSILPEGEGKQLQKDSLSENV